MADKIIIDGQELEDVNGGQGQAGYYMTVGDCNGTYLALRSGTSYSPYNEIAQLYPGYSVFTNGTIVQGTGINGVACYYRYVCFNGVWGYANASFLR